MSRLLSCNAIVDHALREIGSFSSYDNGADVAEHAIGLERLDIMVAELAGIENLWFLRPARQVVPVPVGVARFSLAGLLSPSLQFFDNARITLPESPAVERSVRMIRRADYDAIAEKATVGDPTDIHIERNDAPHVHVYPVPGRAGVTLVLDGQAYADSATDNLGRNNTNFPAAWQRHLILALAADLGAGPVRTIPMAERQDKERRANVALGLLLARNNVEQTDRPLLTRPYDPVTSGRRGPGDYGKGRR